MDIQSDADKIERYFMDFAFAARYDHSGADGEHRQATGMDFVAARSVPRGSDGLCPDWIA